MEDFQACASSTVESLFISISENSEQNCFRSLVALLYEVAAGTAQRTIVHNSCW